MFRNFLDEISGFCENYADTSPNAVFFVAHLTEFIILPEMREIPDIGGSQCISRTNSQNLRDFAGIGRKQGQVGWLPAKKKKTTTPPQVVHVPNKQPRLIKQSTQLSDADTTCLERVSTALLLPPAGLG